MVSPSRSFPLTKIASIVVPKPGMAFTSNTVACIKTQEKEETFFQTMVKQLGQEVYDHILGKDKWTHLTGNKLWTTKLSVYAAPWERRRLWTRPLNWSHSPYTRTSVARRTRKHLFTLQCNSCHVQHCCQRPFIMKNTAHPFPWPVKLCPSKWQL